MTILRDPATSPGSLVWQIQDPCWDLEKQSSLRPHGTDAQEETHGQRRSRKMTGGGTGEEREVRWTLCRKSGNSRATWLSGKESSCRAGDTAWIPGWERAPGEGNGNSLQYSCLENPMDRGAWWDMVYGVKKSQKWLSDLAHTQIIMVLFIPFQP